MKKDNTIAPILNWVVGSTPHTANHQICTLSDRSSFPMLSQVVVVVELRFSLGWSLFVIIVPAIITHGFDGADCTICRFMVHCDTVPYYGGEKPLLLENDPVPLVIVQPCFDQLTSSFPFGMLILTRCGTNIQQGEGYLLDLQSWGSDLQNIFLSFISFFDCLLFDFKFAQASMSEFRFCANN